MNVNKKLCYWDPDNLPPILDYSRERKLSRFTHDFPAKSDEEAINIARQYADQFYKEERTHLPKGCKRLANRPVLEKLFEIRPPRRIKL
jgi:hypothetical protein